MKPLIFVIEDNPWNVRLIREILGSQYEIVDVPDGADAMKYLNDNTPQIILLDVMLPGVSGDIVATRIRSIPRLAQVPIIVLTANADIEIRRKCMDAGANAFIVKPFTKRDLISIVEEQLNQES